MKKISNRWLLLGLLNLSIITTVNALDLASFRMHLCNYTNSVLSVKVNNNISTESNTVFSIFRPTDAQGAIFTLNAGSLTNPTCSDNYYGMDLADQFTGLTKGNNGRLQYTIQNTEQAQAQIDVTKMHRGLEHGQATIRVLAAFSVPYNPSSYFIYLSKNDNPPTTLPNTPPEYPVSGDNDDNWCLAISAASLTTAQLQKCPRS